MTSLHPVKWNVTRWVGVANMFQRFERLLPSIDESNQEFAEFIPTAIQKNKTRQHKQALADFKSVTIKLQNRDTTILKSHVLFQSLITEFPGFDFAKYIGTTADIIHDRIFENEIIRIQGNNEN